MAKGIHDIGNGNGFLYITKPESGSSPDIVKTFRNDQGGARNVKQLGLQASALAANQHSVGIIEINSVSGTGNITKVTVDGTNQLGSDVAYDGSNSTPEATLADDLADEITSHKASGADYTAQSVGAKVFIYAPLSEGSTPNGFTITLTDDSDGVTSTTTDFDHGSDQDDAFHDDHGYRFFLDADYKASASSCSGDGEATRGDLSNAEEITKWVVNRGYQNAIPETDATISSGVLNIGRQSNVTIVNVDTESNAGTDNLDGIEPNDFSENDVLVIRGKDPGRKTTLRDGRDNITLASTNFKTGDKEKSIALRHNSGTFYEISRSTQKVATVSDLRDAGRPEPINSWKTIDVSTDEASKEGVSDVELDPAKDEKYIEVKGTTTIYDDFVIEFLNSKSGSPKDGDEFIMYFHVNVTLNNNSFILRPEGNFSDTVLTAQQVNDTTWEIRSVYDKDADSWWIFVKPLLDDSFSHNGHIENAFIADSAISPNKANSNMNRSLVTVSNVSFNASMQGDHGVRMPYKGKVLRITAFVDENISGSDDGTITPKDDGNNTMTGGIITVTKNTTVGTSFEQQPSANNTFNTGDIIKMNSDKTTAGGSCRVSLEIERTE